MASLPVPGIGGEYLLTHPPRAQVKRPTATDLRHVYPGTQEF